MAQATNYTGTIRKYYAFLNDPRKPIFQIFKDGKLYTEAYFLGWNGDCYVFDCALGFNHKYHLSKLTDYSFAQSIS